MFDKGQNCFGGTMAMWKIEYDPFIHIVPVKPSSFLPLVFDPPGLPISIHIAIYLPTAGRDSEFVEELSELDSCISELEDKYPGASFYLRGDFNVNQSSNNRIGLLNQFCTSQGLKSVEIGHQTYHHFLGGGSSDSQLDYLLYSDHLSSPEQIKAIICKLKHPLLDSHHDLIVSTFSLPLVQHLEAADYSENIVAPKIINNRKKVIWTESGIVEYQKIVFPLLHYIQQLWLNSPKQSRSTLSLCLQSTNKCLVEAACASNRFLELGKPFHPRSSKTSPVIKESQGRLLKLYKRLVQLGPGPHEELDNLQRELRDEKTKHRKLIRTNNSAQSIQRDSPLFSILKPDSHDIFKSIKAGKSNKARKIDKISVAERVYTGKSVPDGFYDSLLHLKTMDYSSIQNPDTFERYECDYSNILSMCSTGPDIPKITLEVSSDILRRIRPCVNDINSITAAHFLNAGDPGLFHFFLLLDALLDDLSNITIEEVNTVHAAILFKGHDKDRTSSRSYRTISTCPLVAKALDIYLHDLNIDKWNADKAPNQYLGEGSSHELASLLLTEVINHSLHEEKPVFVLYLDAKSAFDRVLRELLVRNLFFCGTTGKELAFINHRLKNRKTIAEWDKQLMGPISDELGVKQGGVNSGEFYKIYGKTQLQMAQDSKLGVNLAKDLTISAIGQADDTALVANDLHSLQNLLQLTLYYCSKFNVELCAGKTVLQSISPRKIAQEVEYLKSFSPVNLHGLSLEFQSSAEHVGVIRSVTGNHPNILNRVSKHKKAVGAILCNGLARHHRANPAARLNIEPTSMP